MSINNNSNKSNRYILGEKTSNMARKAQYTREALKNSLTKLSTTEKSVLGLLCVIIAIITIILIRKKLGQDKEIRSAAEPLFLTDKPNPGSQEFVVGNNRIPLTNTGQFTYSFWIYIDHTVWTSDTSKGYNDKWKHILHYGEQLSQDTQVSQMPGCWIWPKTNRLWCVVGGGTDGDYGEGIIVNDIPLNRWVNIAMVLNRQMFDVYVNGKLERTVSLYKEVTLNKNGNLYVSSNDLANKRPFKSDSSGNDTITGLSEADYKTKFGDGSSSKIATGFPGMISYIAYYNRALNPKEIYALYLKFKKKVNGLDSKKTNNLNCEDLQKMKHSTLGTIFTAFQDPV
jgi:hypothetical protein